MRLAVTETKWVPVTKEGKARRDKCRREGLCLACMEPIEEGQRLVREVHWNCYMAAYRNVQMGRATFESLIKDGLIGEQGVSGRKPIHPLSKRLSN